ncbi:MAG: LapA family protein [Geminicoccaceae bacterium]
MIKILRLLLGLIGLVVIVAFSVSNRGLVEMGLWPFPDTIQVQLFWVFLFGLALGVILGGVGAWLGGVKKRRVARQTRNKAWALENQVKVMKDQQESAEARAYEASRAVAPAPALKRIAS